MNNGKRSKIGRFVKSCSGIGIISPNRVKSIIGSTLTGRIPAIDSPLKRPICDSKSGVYWRASRFGDFGVQIYRSDVPAFAAISSVTIPLYRLARELGGEYDGWETEAINSDPV